MDETPRPGPFDQFSFRDELILDIQDVVSFLERFTDQLDTGDLQSMSISQLEAELRSLERHLSAILHQLRTSRAPARVVASTSAEGWGVAGAHYSWANGMHISERSG